jgi:hypothetical protein
MDVSDIDDDAIRVLGFDGTTFLDVHVANGFVLVETGDEGCVLDWPGVIALRDALLTAGVAAAERE